MRVSAKAEYACIAMLELAANRQDAQPTRVKAIADAHGIPQRFLVQILLQLKGAGLVNSTRGASGGYHLTKPAETISLADILSVIDGPPSIRSEADNLPHSPTVQAIRSVWRDVQAEEERLLESISLAELVRRAQHPDVHSYQI